MSQKKRIKKCTLKLECKFADQELIDRAFQLSALSSEYDKAEDDKSEANKEFNEQLKALRGNMRGIAVAIERRGEERAVDCVTTFHDPEVGFKTTVRTDTGEIVSTQPMDDEERQENLFEETQEIERMFNAPDPRNTEPPNDEAQNADMG